MRDAWTRTSRYHVSSIVRNSGDGMIHTLPLIGVRSRQKPYSYHGDSTSRLKPVSSAKRKSAGTAQTASAIFRTSNTLRFLKY